MHNAFTRSSTSGYVHWWCAQNTTGDNALIRLDGDSYAISARLWAFASYFRFARPGAVRVDAVSSVEEVYVTAFVNTNGSVAVVVVNEAHVEYGLTVDLWGVANVSRADAYLTDIAHNVSLVQSYEVSGGRLNAVIEPRAAKTFFLQ